MECPWCGSVMEELGGAEAPRWRCVTTGPLLEFEKCPLINDPLSMEDITAVEIALIDAEQE